MNYPKPFEDLIDCFKLLPGVGAKTAERYAYQVLNLKEEQIQNFKEAIHTTYYQLHDCRICHNLTLDDECELCKDQTRDRSTICVVNKVKDIIAMERCNEYHGLYHVLDGEISASKGIMPEDINLKSLLKRIDENIKEVILATNPTIDGETTALYIAKLLEPKNIIVTRLAHGLPMGGHLDYADDLTIIKAMEGRKRI